MNSITFTYAAIFLFLLFAALFFSGLDGSIRDRQYRLYLKKKKVGNLKPAKRTIITRAKKINETRHLVMSEVKVSNTAYYIMTAAGAFGGFFVGKIYFSGLLFAFAVALIGALAPLLYLEFRQTSIRSSQVHKLLSSMMILSNSYVVTEDFIKSVHDNIDVLEYSSPFRDFLIYVSLIDSNIKTGLRRMETKVNNIYFSQWVDVLIMAQDDRSIKAAPISVVEAMKDVHIAQRESDTSMFSIWREYFTVLILIFSAPIIFRIMMKEAYVILVTSLPGKALLMLLLVFVAWSVVKAVKINKPLLM